MALSVRLLLYSLSLLGLLGLTSGCAKDSHFAASNEAVNIEDLQFEKAPPKKSVWKWVQREEDVREVPESPEQVPQTEITYGKMHFDQLHATTNEQGLVVSGDFYFEKNKIASGLEFTTSEIDGFKYFLQTSNADLNESLKASITCLEDLEPGTACKEFFIDFYYKKDGKMYSDQFVIDQATDEKIQSTKEKESDEKDAEGEEEPEVKDDHTEMMEDDGVVIEQGAYIGTPVLDLYKLFYEKKKAESTPSTTMTTTTSTTSTSTTSTTVPPKVTPAQPSPSTSSTTTTSTTTTSTSTTSTTIPPKGPPTTLPVAPAARITGNQSVGNPQRGSLSNATNFLEYSKIPDSVFKILLPEQRRRYYGSFNLLRVVNDLGKFVQTLIPDYKLAIRDISRIKGGTTGHGSHQNGLDADIRYLTKSDGPELINVVHSGKVTEDFLVAPQWQAFKHVVATDNVVMIYVDKVVKAALCEHFKALPDAKISEKVTEAKRVFQYLDQRAGGHHNHFHLRIKCGDNQPRCRVQKYHMPDQCI